MNKIKKYLLEIGYEISYERYYQARHYNGRSFYNNGTYDVEVYKIGNTDYYIHHKSSGRPAYYLYHNKKLETVRFSQFEFCNMLMEKQLN